MTSWSRKTAVIGAVLAAIAISAGVAVAGGVLGSDKEKEAFLADAAKRLDVTPAQLEAALKGAYDARIDAAVAAGKITKEQGEAMKQRARAGGLPGFGGGRHGGPGGHRGAKLEGAATYLGLTEAQLRAELESGKTLAEVAKDQGRSVDGLKATLKAEIEKQLDAAVEAGRLTQMQAEEKLSRMSDRLDDIVNGAAHAGGHHGRGWGGPAAAIVSAAAGGSVA